MSRIYDALNEDSLAGSLLRELLENVRDPRQHLQSLHEDLESVGVEYAIVGGIALGYHNYPRFTEDIDILVTKETAENLKKLHGRGYGLRPGATWNMYMFTGGPKIQIDVLIEGQQQDNMTMPDPTQIREFRNGVWWVSLPALIALKLESGRERDVSDVRELITRNKLTSAYVERLLFAPEHVQKDFLELA